MLKYLLRQMYCSLEKKQWLKIEHEHEPNLQDFWQEKTPCVESQMLYESAKALDTRLTPEKV